MPPKGWRKSKSAGTGPDPKAGKPESKNPGQREVSTPAAPLPTAEKPSPPAELKAKSDIPPPSSFEQYQAATRTVELPTPETTKTTTVSKSRAAEAFADLVKSGRHRIAVLTEYDGQPPLEPNQTWELGDADRGPYVTIFTFLLEKYKWDPTMIGIVFAGLTIALEMAVTGFGYVKWNSEKAKATGGKK